MVENKKEQHKREIKIKAYDIVTVDFGDVPIGSEQGAFDLLWLFKTILEIIIAQQQS